MKGTSRLKNTAVEYWQLAISQDVQLEKHSCDKVGKNIKSKRVVLPYV